MTTTDTAIDDLRRDLKQRHLTALWELEAEIMGLTPSPQTQAWLWEWSDLYDVAQRAGALIPVRGSPSPDSGCRSDRAPA